MGQRFNGKRVLITGAASGIGRATALTFAREGARVAVTDRDEAGARAVADEILAADGEALGLALDVADEPGWEATLAQVSKRWGGLDVLVANAGRGCGRMVVDTPLEEWRAVMAVNLDGVFLALKHGIPELRESGGGNIVIVSSVSGLKAMPGASAYSASKAALRMLCKTAAVECAAKGDGVRVNAVLPGGVETPIWKATPYWAQLSSQLGDESAVWAALSSSTPFKRFAQPEEIAHAILYLASDEAAYVTGTELVIDGGYSA
ncbi:MAG: SDR family NAD(P)-dependent oxidoreductase [Actinomycetota bacterium]